MDERNQNRDPAGITALLQQIKQGDVAAESELMPLIYPQLRAIARNQMARERPDHSLQATILVHDAFLQLVGNSQIDWSNRFDEIAEVLGISDRTAKRDWAMARAWLYRQLTRSAQQDA